jgi:hypothetical protein
MDKVRQLVDRTELYRAQKIDEAEWEANPGLEEIWVDMLRQLGLIH